MGEYADMMINQQSGGYYEPPKWKPKPKCAKCGRKFRTVRGLDDHMRDKHQPKEPKP